MRGRAVGGEQEGLRQEPGPDEGPADPVLRRTGQNNATSFGAWRKQNACYLSK
jgi:hypothetical protein